MKKVCEINTLYDRLGPNQGSPTVFKILKRPMKSDDITLVLLSM
jgi:hypothetical protein